jgi:two-component sensor histidine kinase
LSKPAVWSEDRLRLAIDAAGVALWSWNVDDDTLTMDERGYALWAVPLRERVTFEGLSARIHPADRDRVRAAFSATRALTGLYEIDFRILIGKIVRWISARGQGADSGMVGRVLLGVFLDVTGRKQAEESHELIAGEMSHRVKNLLAVATGLTHITARSTTTPTEMAKELTGRLMALGRAHDLVRPVPGKEGKAALIGDLIAVLLAPYDDTGAFSGRVRVSVPRMGIGEKAATTVALVFHELATNSLKYGALSSDAGTLDVSSTPDEKVLTLKWIERGGPPVSAPDETGYGSTMIGRLIAAELDGTIHKEWSPEGVEVTVTIRKDRLAQ